MASLALKHSSESIEEGSAHKSVQGPQLEVGNGLVVWQAHALHGEEDNMSDGREHPTHDHETGRDGFGSISLQVPSNLVKQLQGGSAMLHSQQSFHITNGGGLLRNHLIPLAPQGLDHQHAEPVKD